MLFRTNPRLKFRKLSLQHHLITPLKWEHYFNSDTPKMVDLPGYRH